MDLSIIVVNWNTREMLRDCLASVLASPGLPETELIVVDNASTDGSPDMIARDFPDAVLIRNTENRGFAAANNQAMAIARGRHVLLLNSDTLVHGDVIGRSVAWLEAHPDAGAMGCRVLNANGTVQLTCSRFPTLLNLFLTTTGLWKLHRPAFFGRFLMTDWKRDSERDVEVISGCYLLVRAEVIAEVGPLDEAFYFYGEETDWCRRIAAAGRRLCFAPVGTITHFGGGTVRKLSHRRDVLLTGAMVRLHRKHGGRAAALACFLLLAGFNLSRAAFWSLASLVRPGTEVRDRARHFRAVLRHSAETWPRAAA